MRLFVGLDLPWPLREQIDRLAGSIPGARFVPEENLHLTLRFIGEVTPVEAEEIDLALTILRGRAVTLTFTGVGTFAKGGRETQLWVGVERNPALDHLQGKIETALQRAGLPPERRRFTPHVTLARLDNAVPHKIAEFLQAHNLYRSAPVAFDHFTLFSSLLGKDAAVYTAEVEYELD